MTHKTYLIKQKSWSSFVVDKCTTVIMLRVEQNILEYLFFLVRIDSGHFQGYKKLSRIVYYHCTAFFGTVIAWISKY